MLCKPTNGPRKLLVSPVDSRNGIYAVFPLAIAEEKSERKTIKSTTSARIVRTRRGTALNVKISKFLDPQNPRSINNEILSLVESRNFSTKRNNTDIVLDQQVDQSEIVLLNADNVKDLESIEHALSIAEYEPQKINKKGKRKTVDTFNSRLDTVVSASENANLASPEIAEVYYEVPRTVQSKKVIITPQHYSRPIQNVQKSSEIDPKSRSSDIEYIYPASTPKTIKQRFSRTRSPLNPVTTIPTDETKFENTPIPRITPPYRQYSTSSTEPRKQKYYTDTITITTPSSDVSYSTKATRRKKSRKRVADKASSSQENNNNYPSEFPKARSSANSENRNKSRRLSLTAKYDVAPRSFSAARSAKGTQESNLEKSTDERVALNNRNTHTNSAKSGENESNNYSKTTEPIRSYLPSLNRKLYDRKDAKESSTINVNIKDSPRLNKLESFKQTSTERPNPPYKNHQISETIDSSEDKRSNIKSDLGVSNRVTPSSLDLYQNIKTPVVTVHSVSPVVSTMTPYTLPNVYSSNYVYYPPLLSTLPPVQHFEVSTIDPWNSETKLSQPKKRNEEIVEKERRIDEGETSDGVAEATGDGNEGLKKDGKYEIHETPDEGRQSEDHSENHDHQGYEYIQDEPSAHERDDSDNYRNYEGKGYGRYAQKFDDTRGKDVLTDGSHDSESQSVKEGAAGNGGSGQEKFEKGEGTERKEEHHGADGEKGEKGYKSWHEHEKANKGHHDKERRSNYYDEEDGKEKEEKEEGGYHEEHQEGEKGEKEAEFGEKGEHQKGYSTKGQHSIHKKDEFEKRTEFFDEFNEDGDTEKNGEFYQEHKMSKGGNYKVGHHDEDDHEEMYGKEGKHEKGSHHHDNEGHKIEEGKDSHYDHENMHGKKKDHHDGKKWTYKKGDDGNAGEEKQ
ncbi:hypothetical protein ANTRET_LOCUS2006 [Anthophora retusa]